MRRPFCLPILLAAGLAHAQNADLAVVNAHIYTVDNKMPQAAAMAVRKGLIVALGQDVKALIGPSTKVVDAHAGTVIPGLIDSHGHVLALGTALDTLDLRGMDSEKAIADKVRAAAQHARPGEWILGRAWDQNLWAIKDFPTAESISAAAPNNPVALTRVDGHMVWANRKALEMADINAATKDPRGGRVMRDASGRLPVSSSITRKRWWSERFPRSPGSRPNADCCARFRSAPGWE